MLVKKRQLRLTHGVDREAEPMSLIVYGDFGLPECHLASRRVDALAAAGVATDWRAVESAPDLPVTGRRLTAGDQDALAERCRLLDGLLLPGERLPWAVPGFVPRTEAAVSGYAEAHGTKVDADVRRLLFELYWRDGMDIGSPTALRVPLAGPMLRAGVDAVRRLGKELLYRGAEVDPELPDPRRYPAVAGKPSRTWVSETGGRWRNAYRPDTGRQLVG